MRTTCLCHRHPLPLDLLVPTPLAARKQWLAGHLQMKGQLIVDDGAVSVLTKTGSSLLPVGVKAVLGQFSRGDMVVCEDQQGVRVACGPVVSQALQKTRTHTHTRAGNCTYAHTHARTRHLVREGDFGLEEHGPGCARTQRERRG